MLVLNIFFISSAKSVSYGQYEIVTFYFLSLTCILSQYFVIMIFQEMCFICNHMPIGELNTLLQLHISYSKKLLIPVVVGLILTDEREGKIDSYRKIFISTPVGFFV